MWLCCPGISSGRVPPTSRWVPSFDGLCSTRQARQACLGRCLKSGCSASLAQPERQLRTLVTGGGQVEIVVLGSRTGETILIGLDPETWVIVDSFRGAFADSNY